MNQTYNAEYYHSGCGPIPYEQPEHWVNFFGKVADKIVNTLNPKTVLDAGCAMGYLVGALRDRGVDAYGVDISEYAISMVREDIKPYCFVGSLTESLPDNLPKSYDLVITIEVLEHLSALDGKKAIANLCRLSDTIIFSSTPDDITEPTHINVQQREYWSRIFAEHGFYNDLDTKPSYITNYAVCYRKKTEILSQIESYERHIRLSEASYQAQLLQAQKRPFIATLYWGNEEHDLSEEQTITVQGNKSEGMICFQAHLAQHVSKLRFDPMETPCIIEDLHIYSNAGTLHVSAENGIEYQGKYVFLEHDPRFQIILGGKQITSLDIRAHVIPLDYPEQEELVNELFKGGEIAAQEAAQLRAQITEQRLNYEETIEENLAAHKAKLAESQAAYEAELAKSQAAHEEELVKSQAAHEEELVKSQAAHEEELAKSQAAHEEALAKSQAAYKNLLKQAEQEYEAALIDQKNKYEQCISSQERNYTDKIQQCNVELQKLQLELDDLKNHYQMSISQRDDLIKQLDVAKYDYNVISNAFYWKITAPLRKLTDLLKQPFRRNPHAQLLRKGIRCLRQNGLKYTWAKVKTYKHKQPPTQPNTLTDATHESESQQFSKELQTICFSVVVPLYNTPETFLREMIDSVVQQTYQNWELCLADGSDSSHSYVGIICTEYSKKDPRICYQKLEKNSGISDNTNACVAMASGDYIGLLDHDDVLMPDALYANFEAIQETGADVLYSDEDHLSILGTHISPFFKPDWSPDLLYGQMYICHFLVFKRKLFDELGGFRSQFDGSQDYDFMLRLSEKTDQICHIPRILYSWRESETSTALNADSKPYSHTSGKSALDEHLKRKYGPYAHAEDSQYMFVYDARFDLLWSPKVSIIIPMKDKWEMTANCINSIVEKSTYKNYEIIILDNRSEQEATKEWFQQVTKNYKNISVIFADMEFNWSKLNNFGMRHATGDVYVFLNNDTLIISPDWLERLVENAYREEIGVVGALLLYPDNTIQHAGVVVGIGGWADHIFKGMQPIHSIGPYVSPVISRNVLAVTGACMAVSKRTIEQIGEFDERFVICGSDVELCIRAYEHGLFNRMDSNVRLYHLESKSRDAYIPEIDFKMSYEVYQPYRENVDPYFNINLDPNSVIPKERVAPLNLVNFKNFLKRNRVTQKLYQQIRESLTPYDYTIAEIQPIVARKSENNFSELRLNLLIPSVDRKHVFGGIATALHFFRELCDQCDCSARIIVMDAPVDIATSVDLQGYEVVSCEEDSTHKYQIVPMADRHSKTLPVGAKDIFVATGWWTAYVISDVCHWQRETYHSHLPLIYMIQDYEPGFYPWSSRYMLADSTYRLEIPTYAVFNSSLLKNYFDSDGYEFAKCWTFDPVLNEKIKQYLPENGCPVDKKKQILVYGRPSVERNAFSLIVYALKQWCAQYSEASEWTILSAGEAHADIDLGNGCILHSVGKLSLDEYSQILLDSYAGISLMVSPHPSYPPLEMSTFGVNTITNCYGQKDLATFNDNIFSLKSCSPHQLAEALVQICSKYNGQGVIVRNTAYTEDTSPFTHIAFEIKNSISEILN